MNVIVVLKTIERIYSTSLILGYYVIMSFFIEASATAGGGGGGGGGGAGGVGGSGGEIDPVIIFFMLFLFGVYFLGLHFYTENLRKRKRDLVAAGLDGISAYDDSWDKKNLLDFSMEQYKNIQDAWSIKDRGLIQTYLTKNLYEDWKPMLDKMDKYGQRNVIEDLRVISMEIIDLKDRTDDRKDRFSVKIIARARDYTITDDGDWTKPKWKYGALPNKGKEFVPLQEIWTFRRYKETWKLSKIDQITAELTYLKSEVVLDDEKYMHLVMADVGEFDEFEG